MTKTTPESVALKDCECGGFPQVFRACKEERDLWVICCPECGRQMYGPRVEGIDIEGVNIIEVTKDGDCFDTMVKLWNEER